MTHHSVNNNTRMGLVISLCSNANHLISLIPPPPPPPPTASNFRHLLSCCFVRLLAGGDWFQCAFALSVWVVWLSVVGLGSLEVTLGVFLVHRVLCCAGGFLPSMLVGLMDDETSCHYIFFFMLLPIPFLVIGLSIKENI